MSHLRQFKSIWNDKYAGRTQTFKLGGKKRANETFARCDRLDPARKMFLRQTFCEVEHSASIAADLLKLLGTLQWALMPWMTSSLSFSCGMISCSFQRAKCEDTAAAAAHAAADAADAAVCSSLFVGAQHRFTACWLDAGCCALYVYVATAERESSKPAEAPSR